jgi:amidase
MAALRFPVAGVRKPFLHCLDWVGLASLAYLPSTVVPVGISRSGTPVAVQVIGPFLEDRTALFVAAELARLVGPLPLATSL